MENVFLEFEINGKTHYLEAEVFNDETEYKVLEFYKFNETEDESIDVDPEEYQDEIKSALVSQGYINGEPNGEYGGYDDYLDGCLDFEKSII